MLAYPPVDVRVRSYLLAAPLVEKEVECKKYLNQFMCAIFSEANSQLLRFAQDAATPMTLKQFAQRFRRLFSNQDERISFYARVIENTSSSYDSLITCSKSLTRTLEAQLNVQENEANWPLCPIILSFDEVHVLFEKHQPDGHSLYSRLKSVLSELRTEPVTTLVLSTASTVSEFAPAQDVAPSIREQSDKLALPEPFTELPFDLDVSLKHNRETLQSVGRLKFTVQFGRPLYVTTNTKLPIAQSPFKVVGHVPFSNAASKRRNSSCIWDVRYSNTQVVGC